jgi:hypothetical protein
MEIKNMCKYSLEGYANRQAREGETVVANGFKPLDGAYGTLTPPSGNELVCMVHGAKLTVEKFPELTQQSNMFDKSMRRVEYNDIVGTRQVLCFVDGRYHSGGYDAMVLKDGRNFPLVHVPKGTEFFVGVKALPEVKSLETRLGLGASILRMVGLDMNSDPKEGEGDKADEPPKEEKADEAPPAAEPAAEPAKEPVTA